MAGIVDFLSTLLGLGKVAGGIVNPPRERIPLTKGPGAVPLPLPTPVAPTTPVAPQDNQRFNTLLEELTTQPPQASVDANIDLLARTLWGEARGEGPEGMRAVGHVILNRLNDEKRRFGGSLEGVIKKPAAFSAWNRGDPNYDKMLRVGADDPAYQTAVEIAQEILKGSSKDPTQGATHYHAANIVPSWARSKGAKKSAALGRHLFYTGVA